MRPQTPDPILPHGTASVEGDVLGIIEGTNGTVREGLWVNDLVAPSLAFVVTEIDTTALALGFGQTGAIGNRKEQTLAAPGKRARR